MVDIAAGDIVHIRAKVLYSDDPLVGYVQVGDGKAFYINRAHIFHVEPRPLQVGDVVTWGTVTEHYSLLAIDSDYAWLNLPGHRPWTASLSDLKLVARTPNTTTKQGEMT